MQCEQKFNSMDLELRTNVTEIFKEKVGKYGLEDITYNSFTAAFGFRHKFCAADVAHAVRALLEYQHSISQGQDAAAHAAITADNFLESLRSLNRFEIDVLETGIERAKAKLKLINDKVLTIL